MRSSKPRSRWRRRATYVVLGILLLVAVLAVLALPMRSVPGNARVAKTDLTGVKEALKNGDVVRARELVADARKHVDAAQGVVGGFGGTVWSLIPVVGTPVADARDLVQALDDGTTVAEIGVRLYPSVAGKHATLFHDKQIDRATLQKVIAAAHQLQKHLASAQAALADVSGDTPFVGHAIATRRDQAAAVIDPLAESFDHLAPMLDRLPSVFGFDGKRRYLIAMLNPAELRYSGGAALSFAPLRFDRGKAVVDHSLAIRDHPRLQAVRIRWPGVPGNPFHHPGPDRLTNATFAPSWSVSGEELLRAWHSARGEHDDGVIAIDVPGLADLVGAVGGIDVPGYGHLTQANLAKTLIGSYDKYYPDPSRQDALNSAVIPAFERKFLGGGHYVAKVQALGAAATGRHFALYFRDPTVQKSIAASGLDGDLASPRGDYLGVFTQNTNGSKVDFYQRRDLALDVTLGVDGSARDRLGVAVHNDTPPYAVPGVDPRTGYFTRWGGMAVGMFVPGSARVQGLSVLGHAKQPRPGQFYDHAYVAPDLMLSPGATGTLSLRYQVPHGATVGASGELTYRLAADPQGMVTPESVKVTVHLPAGYVAKQLPPGWSANGSTLTYPAQPLSTGQNWTIVAVRG